jgi:LysM repeat protein
VAKIEDDAISDSGVVHTAVKGDNPVTIAHHYGVSYDDLLKLNKIEDPKRLQIGQKLHIPMKRNGEQPNK